MGERAHERKRICPFYGFTGAGVTAVGVAGWRRGGGPRRRTRGWRAGTPTSMTARASCRTLRVTGRARRARCAAGRCCRRTRRSSGTRTRRRTRSSPGARASRARPWWRGSGAGAWSSLGRSSRLCTLLRTGSGSRCLCCPPPPCRQAAAAAPARCVRAGVRACVRRVCRAAGRLARHRGRPCISAPGATRLTCCAVALPSAGRAAPPRHAHRRQVFGASWIQHKRARFPESVHAARARQRSNHA